MRHSWLAVGCVVLAACGPSKKEREAMQRELDAAAKAQKEKEAKEAKTVEDLGKLAELMRGSCAQEFARAGTENLGPGEAGPCALPDKPLFRTKLVSARSSAAELAESYKKVCDDVQAELDLAVKRAAPSNTSAFRMTEAEKALDTFSRTVLAGVVYEKSVTPMVVKDKLGNPSSFRPGLVEGAALLYSIGAGKLLCASKVAAKSSEKVETFKFEPGSPMGPDGTAMLDVFNDLNTQTEKALESAPRLALAPVPKAAPPPPEKKAKKAPAKKKKGR